MDFTIGVLLFGDTPELAERCLKSLWQLPRERFQLRLGLNATSEATQQVVNSFLGPLVGSRDVLYISSENIGKYPLMRRMVHDGQRPIATPYFMWFDDDSYVRDAHGSLLDTVAKQLTAASMLGSIYRIAPQAGQWAWVQDQPWYSGKPLDKVFQFCTGGWWAIHTELLYRYNWPLPELVHRGGDVMLGELLRQQGHVLKHFNQGVAINADAAGRECKAPKRGYNSPPIGAGYVAPARGTL